MDKNTAIYLGDYITNNDEYFQCFFVAEIEYAAAFGPFNKVRMLDWAKAKTEKEAKENIIKKLGPGHFKQTNTP